MISSHLRHITAEQLNIRQLQSYWQREGIDITPATLPDVPGLLKFKTDRGWEGVIVLRDWFSYALPDSARLAATAFNLEQLKDLFLNSETPIISPLEQWGYSSLLGELCSYVDTCVIDKTQALKVEHGHIWLSRYPLPIDNDALVNKNKLNFSQLPIKLDFELGTSQMRLSLLSQIKPGDVVLINHVQSHVVTCGKVIGLYEKCEEDIMVTQYDELMDETELQNDDLDTVVAGRDLIPIRLTFILEQRTVTLSELEQIYLGQTIPYDEEQEKRVIISANGVHIARGELVWLGNRLGVEVVELHNEVGHVK